jgi:hypothetical protein
LDGRDGTTMTRFLHVANGGATTNTIRKAGIAGTLSHWADVLTEGPVPAVPDEELLRIRAGQLAPEGAFDEVVEELRGWRAAIDNDSAYDELILWYEHDLFDQLNLIQVLSWIGRNGSPSRRVSLICIGSFPGRPSFKGLGELTPAELASLLPARQPVSGGAYALAAAAWDAFRSPDPRRIEELLRDDTSALPFLAPAFQRYLEEFPSTVDGLSRSERRLLELVTNGPAEIRDMFPLMHRGETAFYITDGAFWTLLCDLRSLSPPLLAVTADGWEREQLPRGTVALTDTGREVLAGTIDRIRCCGLDRWLGGVHLGGTHPEWRWDPTKRCLALHRHA